MPWAQLRTVSLEAGQSQSLIPDPKAAWLNTLGVVAPPMAGLSGVAFEPARATLARLTGGLRRVGSLRLTRRSDRDFVRTARYKLQMILPVNWLNS